MKYICSKWDLNLKHLDTMKEKILITLCTIDLNKVLMNQSGKSDGDSKQAAPSESIIKCKIWGIPETTHRDIQNNFYSEVFFISVAYFCAILFNLKRIHLFYCLLLSSA